jgi:hypothetical protein
MMNMSSQIIVMEILVAAMILLSSGCASYSSYNASSRELNSPAIRAVQLDGGAGIGVDIGAIDTLMQHPIRQTLAALLDAGTLYAAIEGIDSLNGSDKEDNTTYNATSGDSVDITINGENNTVNIGNTEEVTN